MQNLQVATFMCMMLLFASCDKQDVAPTPPDYFPMEIGNQWVYGEREFDRESMTLEPYNSNTIVHTIVATETIDGEDYFKFEQVKNEEDPTFYYLRLAANGNIVNETGDVYFSPTNFTDVLKTVVTPASLDGYVEDMYFRMIEPSEPVIVPAGEFSTLRFRGTADLLKTNEYGLTEIMVSSDYAAGIGPVRTAGMALVSLDIQYQDLMSYTLN